MNLLELCEPVFLKVCELNRMARLGVVQDYLEARSELEVLLDEIQQRSSSDARLAAQAKKLELPLTFFVDSMIASSRLPFAVNWNENRLAKERHNRLAGNDCFFDLLQETLEDASDEASERLAVFYACLGLGFVGGMVGQPWELNNYMEQIAPRIRNLMDLDTRSRLCPEAYNCLDTRNLVVPPRSRLPQIVRFIVAWPWLLSKKAHELLDAYSQQAVQDADLVQSPTKMRKIIVACLFLCWTVFLAYYGAAKLPTITLNLPWLSQRVFVLATITLLLVSLLLIGCYALWLGMRRRRASMEFVRALGYESASSTLHIRDVSRQADLDGLRRRFMDGVEVYRRGKIDLYRHPWFLVIGESGSGKTEAIRRSNLDFPAIQNNLMQGVGGTVSMDWWFTNHGVLLDTGGRHIIGESEDYPKGSFLELLKLLRSYRPHCPINGLLLVLSVEGLIKDSAADIASKAARIARRLDLIKHTLNIRFPVSVLVTKCDKLTGFREFFESIDDPGLQDQMVGWSSPDPLDQPFRPELVDQHLGQVIARLRKRRLGVLYTPLPVGGGARRVDEVDALYALPKSLSLIMPRLRRYLETIFVAGEFSAKPVFLRGIYFTSAMQAGADLDEAVWNALGRSTPAPETTGTSTQDLARPFFLRDVFLEKLFREKGLVVPLTKPSLL